MYSETLEKMNKYGMAKVNLLKESKLKYFVASMLAGLYVGLGIILIMTIGGYTKHGGMQYKVFMGLAFGIALSLVIMAGSELFTGNNMLMTSGMLSKKITVKDGISCQVNMKMSQILPNISTDFHGAFAFLNVYQKTVVSTDE